MNLPPTSYNPSTNTGLATVTPTGENHTEDMTFSGAAGNYNTPIAISPSNVPGDRVVVRATFPATPNLVPQFRNGTATGSILVQYNTNGSTLLAVFEFVFNNIGAWEYLRAKAPA